LEELIAEGRKKLVNVGGGGGGGGGAAPAAAGGAPAAGGAKKEEKKEEKKVRVLVTRARPRPGTCGVPSHMRLAGRESLPSFAH
jgi:hypothetical protein